MQSTVLNNGTVDVSSQVKALSERSPLKKRPANPFGFSRDFLTNRFVYLTISPRARGLSVGININPDKACNFDCLYCEVDRTQPGQERVLDCEVAAKELEGTLSLVTGSGLRELPPYNALRPELLTLRHVALSGDGEPTASPKFREAVEMAVHTRARGRFPFFKLVLITNGTHLAASDVEAALSLFTARDEIWAKLDAGTQSYMNQVNRTRISIESILSNILHLARKHPVIIQSLFSSVDGVPPSHQEIAQFSQRLKELKDAGAQIPLVQIYSATRPAPLSRVEHLPLRVMAEIANSVRRTAGIRAEIF